ncbi:hypothetical protein AN216_19445 [Streptomyces oceani]|uniref:Peptidase C39-like domain-containing protein n=1 Tax=Streptomyces oceani TaxID=1075402 RepID=A0A1E7JYE7_9ACTN|nr:hypothetical protein AN216_19445 [Streptomyces oceani]
MLAAALAAAAAAGTTATAAAGTTAPAGASSDPNSPRRGPNQPRKDDTIEYQGWSTRKDWRGGSHEGTGAADDARAGIVIGKPVGEFEYADPHTGKTATWEYARWTSPRHDVRTPAGEAIASWNAHTPAGTWIRVELRGRYSDGTDSPWYTLGIWTAGDGKDVPRRTSVADQSDGKSSVSVDTFVIDDLDSGLRLSSYELRVTLYRAPGGSATPTVRRVGAMSSDVEDRFEVPASEPGEGAGKELKVPRYSQNIHEGEYPEYDGGGEAWCSPTSAQMIIEYWGRKPTPEDLEWVNPDYQDPQVCHAARFTYDYQYEGCGNWPFNTAYAATYEDMQAVVTRCGSLLDAERLVAAGIPVITSQSFIESELDGAGYGTAGHLMTVIGFTEDGDVVANDPASPDNPSVRHVYKRRQFENIWLRTKRKDEKGEVKGATGGVCYVFFPAEPAPTQRRVLQEMGIM